MKDNNVINVGGKFVVATVCSLVMSMASMSLFVFFMTVSDIVGPLFVTLPMALMSLGTGLILSQRLSNEHRNVARRLVVFSIWFGVLVVAFHLGLYGWVIIESFGNRNKVVEQL